VADKDGEIVMVNRRFEEMSGYHRSELVGQAVEIMVPDRYKGIHPSHRESYLVSSSNRPMRGLSFRHKRGREIAAGIWLGHFSDPNDGYTIVKMRATDEEALKSSNTLKCIAE
jgi:PAS domain S-box-containing protein